MKSGLIGYKDKVLVNLDKVISIRKEISEAKVVHALGTHEYPEKGEIIFQFDTRAEKWEFETVEEMTGVYNAIAIHNIIEDKDIEAVRNSINGE